MTDEYAATIDTLSKRLAIFLNDADVAKGVALPALLLVLQAALRQHPRNMPDSAQLILALIPALLDDVRLGMMRES